MVMQDTVLFPGTIADNIHYGPRQHGKSISQRRLRDLMQMVAVELQERTLEVVGWKPVFGLGWGANQRSLPSRVF